MSIVVTCRRAAHARWPDWTGLHWFENVPVSGAGTHDTGAMNGAVLHELRHRCCQIVRTDTHCTVYRGVEISIDERMCIQSFVLV